VTTSTEAGARTAAQLLYVSVDLGPQPSLEDFERNVAAPLTLARYARFISEGFVVTTREGMLEAPPVLPDAPLRVVRTTLASPWISVLADVARNSTPVGYGAAALVALQRLLTMVMTWQRHRQDIAEKQVQLDQLRARLKEENVQRGLDNTHRSDVRILIHKAPPDRGQVEAGFPDLGESHLDEVVQAAADLGEVLEAEMIDPNDPRATGHAGGG
jgi:hypothetical protein